MSNTENTAELTISKLEEIKQFAEQHGMAQTAKEAARMIAQKQQSETPSN